MSATAETVSLRERLYAEAEPFLRAIVDAPGDALPRLVFADWLEERGLDAEAAGQRWAAREGKYPLPASDQETGGWYWDISGDKPRHCQMPDGLYDHKSFDDRPYRSLVAESRGSDLLQCERLLLEISGQRTWGANGEPVGQSRPA